MAPKRDPIETMLVLRAKPAALAARGKPPADPLVLTIESTKANRIGDATAAIALLEAATRMLGDACSLLFMAGAGTTDPSTVYASRAVDEALKATQGAKYVAKTLKR